MDPSLRLWQEIWGQCQQVISSTDGRRRPAWRLAVLVTALITAQSTILARLAAAVVRVGCTATRDPDAAARGLRRILSDPMLRDPGAYQQLLAQRMDWEAYRRSGQPVRLVVDESSRSDQVHLLRVGVAGWGTSLPVAWAISAQNVALAPGAYWAAMDRVLAGAQAVVPADLAVLVLADRAYDVPAFVDRVTARGWHWVVRAQTRSSLRFRTWQGREEALAARVAAVLPRPGCRWKARGAVFKGAGWRTASVVGQWAAGQREPVVVLTDLPPRWEVLAWYSNRFWIEPSFRADKSAGWGWEDSGVQGLEHHAVLLVAMAWATLLVAGVGMGEARARLQRLARRPWRRRPRGWDGRRVRHARDSVLTLGLRMVLWWVCQTGQLPTVVLDLTGPSWNDRWRQAQIARNLANAVRP